MANISLGGTKTLQVTSTSTTTLKTINNATPLVTASFVVNSAATPNSFSTQQVQLGVQEVYSPGSPLLEGFVFTG